MRVACVTTHNIKDSSDWPKNRQGICGASRQISQSLEAENFDVCYLGPLERPRFPITRLKWLFYRHLQEKDYYSWADPIVLKRYARQVQAKVRDVGADIILCPEGFVPISQLNTDLPLVLWTDTPTGSLIGFYGNLSNLCDETIKNIYRYEKAAMERCSLVILTSDWAAKFAMETYGCPAEKIKVIPRGANQRRSLSTEAVKAAVRSRASDHCILTFVGVEWERKGGDVALAVAERLNQRGLQTTLQIIGCDPKIEGKPNFIRSLGFLNRSKPDELQLFEDALLQSHFLVLPSRAEHCAIALSEANSYGVPCLTTDVGGIPTVVKDGRNGKTFTAVEDIDDYCDYIFKCMKDPAQYHEFALSSLHEFETRLSWDISRKRIAGLLLNL